MIHVRISDIRGVSKNVCLGSRKCRVSLKYPKLRDANKSDGAFDEMEPGSDIHTGYDKIGQISTRRD